MNWQSLAAITILSWGIMGLLQKMSSDLAEPAALLVWMIIGLAIGSAPLVALLPRASPMSLSIDIAILGVSCGVANALGALCLFRALARGGSASIAIPLTALYPLITVLLALLFLHENLTLRHGLGALLAVSGGALLSRESTPVTQH